MIDTEEIKVFFDDLLQGKLPSKFGVNDDSYITGLVLFTVILIGIPLIYVLVMFFNQTVTPALPFGSYVADFFSRSLKLFTSLGSDTSDWKNGAAFASIILGIIAAFAWGFAAKDGFSAVRFRDRKEKAMKEREDKKKAAAAAAAAAKSKFGTEDEKIIF